MRPGPGEPGASRGWRAGLLVGPELPRYQQIREVLAQQIRAGSLKPGDQLPSEDELRREFHVTRMTVRQAIAGLVSEGLVYRRHGKGTFVADPKVARRFARLTGFSEDVSARGQTPGARILAIQKTTPPDEAAQALGLESLEEPFPSLYGLLETRYGLALRQADQVIEARQATASEARLLRLPRRAPVVQVTRTTFLDDGRPVEWAQMVYRADLVKFQMQLWRGRE